MDECKLFRVKYEILYKALQTSKHDVVDLAFQLYSKEILSQTMREEVSEAATPRDAASRLLRATEKWIETHPRDLCTFVECLATFPPWRGNAEEMKTKLDEMESKLVQPQPVSEEVVSSCSPLTQQQSLNIRLFISPTGAVTTNPVPEQNERETFNLRSAPVHRKHPQKRDSEASLQTSKVFQQASSPLSTAAHALSSDRRTGSEASVPEEVTDHSDDSPTQLLCSQTSSLSSQISSCSDEDALSMKESFEDILEKYRTMKCKLHGKDKKMKDVQKKYDSGMASANAANMELQEQMKALELENCHMTDELEAARKSVFESNLRKQQLIDQLQDRSIALKRCQDVCMVLEAQVEEAKKGINFYDKYQKSEERSSELEKELEYYKQLAIEHKDNIQHLEMQIDILVSSSSITSSIGDDWALDAEQEVSCTLDSM